MVGGCPPPAQVARVLLNAIFLDLVDRDAQRLIDPGEADARQRSPDTDALLNRSSQP